MSKYRTVNDDLERDGVEFVNLSKGILKCKCCGKKWSLKADKHFELKHGSLRCPNKCNDPKIIYIKKLKHKKDKELKNRFTVYVEKLKQEEDKEPKRKYIKIRVIKENKRSTRSGGDD